MLFDKKNNASTSNNTQIQPQYRTREKTDYFCYFQFNFLESISDRGENFNFACACAEKQFINGLPNINRDPTHHLERITSSLIID